MSLIVKCEEHLVKVRAFADLLGPEQRAQLEHKLTYLEKYGGGSFEVRLYTDMAPHSFGITWHHIRPDGSVESDAWMVGGLIYHASDTSWSVHT